EGGLVELGPDSAARAKGEQADRLAAIAERQDEETRAAVLAGLRVAHHRPVAIVDLRLLARRRLDDRALLGHGRAPQPGDVAPHARVAGAKAVVADQVLPDRHGVAALPQRPLDEFLVRLARARGRRPARPLQRARRRSRVGGRPTGRFCRRRRRVGGRATGRVWRRRRRVGGRPTGRFWRLSLSWTSDRDPGRLEVLARRFPPDSGLLLDPAQRPAKPPQRQYRLLLFFAQDVHSRRGTTSRRFSSTSWRRRYDWPVFRCPSLDGFGCPPRIASGEPGAVGALLRREGLYSSHITTWRAQRERGQLAGLAPQKRGRKAKPRNPLAAE